MLVSRYNALSIVFLFIICFFLENKSLFIITIPKSGSHLLEKAVSKITRKNNYSKIVGSIFTLDPDASICLDIAMKERGEDFLFEHLGYQVWIEKMFYENKEKILFNIRDPRDQVLSYAHWQKDLPEVFPSSINMTFNQVLTDLIKGIDSYYNIFFEWINYPYALTVRFEDLVGSKGGGDDAQQLATVKAIAKHVSVELSEQRAQEIAANLFGDNTRFTFRKGQIGAWKHEFTLEHKELFKQYGGELLIKLGYEKDLNW